MAVAHCRYCSWSVSYRGNRARVVRDVLDEAHFLRDLLIEHVERQHPDEHDAVEHVVEDDNDS